MELVIFIDLIFFYKIFFERAIDVIEFPILCFEFQIPYYIKLKWMN